MAHGVCTPLAATPFTVHALLLLLLLLLLRVCAKRAQSRTPYPC
jgi:hypothetical protein